MRFYSIAMLLVGLAVAVPAPIPVGPSYDRHLPALRGEPPVRLGERGIHIPAAQVTATTAATAIKAKATGSLLKTATAPATAATAAAAATGTASASGIAYVVATKASYNFPSPTHVSRDSEASAGNRFWWLQ